MAGSLARVLSFSLRLEPQSSARFAPSKVKFLSERKKSGSSQDSALAATSISGSGRVRATENHLRAVNDHHDIADRRIPVTPDLYFRRSVFAGHRKISLLETKSRFA